MRTMLVSTLVALGAGTSFHALGNAEHQGHGAMHASPAGAALAEGLVKKIDKAAGKVTLSHGPLPDGMPAMTMVYRVKEAAWLDQMKPGQKILFATQQSNGSYTIVRFEPIK